MERLAEKPVSTSELCQMVSALEILKKRTLLPLAAHTCHMITPLNVG